MREKRKERPDRKRRKRSVKSLTVKWKITGAKREVRKTESGKRKESRANEIYTIGTGSNLKSLLPFLYVISKSLFAGSFFLPISIFLTEKIVINEHFAGHISDRF